MDIIEITEPEHIKEFLEFPVRLYANDFHWVRPLDNDIEKVFDRKRNKFFRHGECIRWLLQDNGKTVGRVAAFINKKTVNRDNDQPTGGMGFFECEKNQEYAFKLFDTCKAWLEQRGMEAMDGPINFGERDEWWGLLVKGFYPPNYGMNYNFSYYQEFFENYGFQMYFGQYTYGRKIAEPLIQKVHDKSERVRQNPDYTFDHLHKKEIERYTEDFRTVYNKAWVRHSGVGEMPRTQARNIMKTMKPLMDEKLVLFAYYKGEPVAFFIMIPDLNQFLKTINGNLGWVEKAKFLWFKLRKKFTKNVGVAFGVVPEHQGKGVESAIVVEYSKFAHTPNYQYKHMEMKWIGDFNPKMMRVAEDVGGSIYKTHYTYRKLFDETKEFKRSPIIG